MTAMAAAPISEAEVALTREGYERLLHELATLTKITRTEIADRLRDAREQGADLADNPELIEALEDQEMLERRITKLKTSLAFARVVDSPPSDGTIGIGTRVRLQDLDSNRTEEYDVVSSIEADPIQRRLSADSPVGRALFGRQTGDVFEVEAPRGLMRYQIASVRPGGEDRRPVLNAVGRIHASPR